MSSTISNVAKILGVCVATLMIYTFLFGTADFFVFDDGSSDVTASTGGYDGAISMVIDAVEKPMAIYYRDYTYKARVEQVLVIEASLTSNLKGSVKLMYTP